ncbi:hypothetical protein [Microcella humidisoli]|uniref:Uncharacterized protein n=1 Tax=Microcella humidisoli TaxID=2963406 RepID=A0ABY5FWQ6_9MICO|nr:hypothetical protein [Microcella humidisoli]UTT62742.1 hypothetical protein NNL39_01070 [Microcella humidisoli]
MTLQTNQPDDDIARIRESAARLGVQLDEEAALQWLAAIAADAASDEHIVTHESGTFGHRVTMLDFTPRDLERFRRIGQVVEVTGPPEIAESALALSGSAAQSKIQSFPGDCDYFQRLNIKAASREEACRIMADLMRAAARRTYTADAFQFLEGKLGSYPVDCEHGGQPRKRGSPITWTPAEIEAERIELTLADGSVQTLTWYEAALDPGWCKLDWVVTDPQRKSLSNASNVIDVTWEGPDGEIVPLDGYLDAYFQEVYLEADDLPTFTKVVQHVSDDALDEYVERLEEEVRKYLTKQVNYGKAAKRMYNIFRLSGRHIDAAYVRELFDEPATILYQVWSLISTLDNATQPGTSIPIDAVRDQADALMLQVIQMLDGDEEAEIVSALLSLRRTLEDQSAGERRTSDVEAAQNRVINLVNTFFRDKLEGVPTIRDYIRAMQGEHA